MRIIIFLLGVVALVGALPSMLESDSALNPSEDDTKSSTPDINGYNPSKLCVRCFSWNAGCLAEGVRKHKEWIPNLRECKVKTLQHDPACKDCSWPPESDPPPALTARGDTCDDCKARYDHCVWLAGISGLPGCEKVCKKRATENNDICLNCDDSYYAPGKLPTKRNVVAASSFIGEALNSGEITPREADGAFNDLFNDMRSFL